MIILRYGDVIIRHFRRIGIQGGLFVLILWRFLRLIIPSHGCGLRPFAHKLTVERPAGSLIGFLRSNQFNTVIPRLIGFSKLPSFWSKVVRSAAFAISSGSKPDSSSGLPIP